MQPLRNRLGVIQKIQPPRTAKGCKSFAGIVNFLSMFCPELQKLLKPIYDQTRKGRPFNWGKEQQGSFEEIKRRLIKPPVLHMPNKTGRFHLYFYLTIFPPLNDQNRLVPLYVCICTSRIFNQNFI